MWFICFNGRILQDEEEHGTIQFSQPVRECRNLYSSGKLSKLNEHIQAGLEHYYFYQENYYSNRIVFKVEKVFFSRNEEYETRIDKDDADDADDTDQKEDYISHILSCINVIDTRHANCKPDIKYCGCGCNKLHDGFDGYCRPYPSNAIPFSPHN